MFRVMEPCSLEINASIYDPAFNAGFTQLRYRTTYGDAGKQDRKGQIERPSCCRSRSSGKAAEERVIQCDSVNSTGFRATETERRLSEIRSGLTDQLRVSLAYDLFNG